MVQEISKTAIQILVPLVATAVGSMLVALLGSVANYFRQQAKSASARKYVDLLDGIAREVVVGLNQTVVDKLKEASADGKLTPEEINSVSAQALETVKVILGVRGIAALQSIFNDIDSLIASKLEYAVVQAKRY